MLLQPAMATAERDCSTRCRLIGRLFLLPPPQLLWRPHLRCHPQQPLPPVPCLVAGPRPARRSWRRCERRPWRRFWARSRRRCGRRSWRSCRRCRPYQRLWRRSWIVEEVREESWRAHRRGRGGGAGGGCRGRRGGRLDEQWTGVAKNKHNQTTTCLFTFLCVCLARQSCRCPSLAGPPR